MRWFESKDKSVSCHGDAAAGRSQTLKSRIKRRRAAVDMMGVSWARDAVPPEVGKRASRMMQMRKRRQQHGAGDAIGQGELMAERDTVVLVSELVE